MAIFLVRHAYSLGNENVKVHNEQGDHAIALTKLGLKQADKVGEFINNYISTNLPPDDRVRLWSSSYLRTTQTAKGLYTHSPNVKWDINPQGGNIFYDARLRERESGYEDGLTDEEVAALFPIQQKHYLKNRKENGKFFAKSFGGESAADVCQRLATFKETMFRDIHNGIKHHVIVNHGFTQRCFVNMFLHLHHEHFELEKNPQNTEVRLLDIIPETGRYGDYGSIYKPDDNIALLEKPAQHKIYKLTL